MKHEESIAKFDRNLNDFVHCIQSLDDRLFSSKLKNWSPRDIIAHLIGWNELLVKGCTLIQNGVLPFYDIDPGDDYSKVNAEIIEKISSTDKNELLAELAASAEKLKEYIETVSSEDYSRDFGVRLNEEVITVENAFNGLTDDYDYHRKQIEEWRKSR
jgi:hypothetical protein